MTNLGPLTTTFTPIGPDCASTFLGLNQNNAWIQYGAGGSASVACLPSGFVPSYSYFYSPGVCPSGYTNACYTQPFAPTQVTKGETQITCCPTSYQCNNRALDDPFACISFFSGTQTFDVSAFTFLTDSAGSTTALIGGRTKGVFSNNFILAYGPIVHIAAGDVISSNTATETLPSSSRRLSGSSTSTSTNTSIITTPPDSNQHRPPGLSQGAVAGIAIGSTLAGLLLIGALTLFLRRRRRLSETHSVARMSEIGAQIKPYQDTPTHSNAQQQHHQQQPYELGLTPEQRHPYELSAA